MDAFRKYFEHNPDLFTGLVALLAIVGTLVAGWVGAKIQANGGREQAAAAREAAAATNEAQRVAALWTVRQVMTVDYINHARENVELSIRMYKESDEDGTLKRQVDASRIALVQKKVGLELIADAPVVAAVKEVQAAVGEFAQNALKYGPGAYADSLLGKMRTMPSVMAAREALHEARECELDAASTDEAKRGARARALRKVRELEPRVSSEQGLQLIRHYMRADGATLDEYREARALVQNKTEELIAATRIMLKSEEDVAAEEVPTRRWGWRRRNSPVTATDSA
ncbi:BAR domain-containing protein [Streptomyces stackebrandtii]|uniref:hypothetical protein n=1 Tax=Streptomyces stackebrandtii TaxID=3051177 RepID=UPI0028DCDCFE|nr:hypothetical protein [Streptomyces sp. DSM 40976]